MTGSSLIKSNLLLLGFLCLMSLQCGAAGKPTPEVRKGVLDLRGYDFKKSGVVPLKGEWEFYWKQLLYSESNAGSRPASANKEYTRVPGSWSRQKHKKFPAYGYASYRLVILLDPNPGLMAFSLSTLGSAYTLYVNGKALAAGGRVGKTKEEMVFNYRPGIFGYQPRSQEVEVVITASNFHQIAGGQWYAPDFGLKDVMHRVREGHLVRDYCIFGLLLIMVVYHMILFVLRRSETLPLYFSGFALVIALRIPVHGEMYIYQWIPGFPVELVIIFQYGAFFAGVPLIAMFFRNAFPSELPTIPLRIMVGVGVVVTALVALGSARITTGILPFYRIFTILAIGVALYTVFLAFIRKRDGSLVILVGTIVLMITIMNDILYGLEWVDTGWITPYGMVVFILSKSTLLSLRFYRAFETVKDLSRDMRNMSLSLEVKVDERTEELRRSLDEVHQLKARQDGDYFLTSLLIQPLSGNHAARNGVNVELLERQFKRFKFKKWDSEIGGDYSFAINLYFDDKTYTLVLNSDSMGKSMQGAGGALVLGSVFRSIIERTRKDRKLQKKTPDEWLRSCCEELESVFISFEGSMMVSLVLGLIAEDEGVFYYVIADHPLITLYRDGRASFIEEQDMYPKIGCPDLGWELIIKKFPMQPGDVLLLGSDGRDDVVLGVDEDGERVINEDETLFLKHVEQGRGVLSEIEKAILGTGELMDDFSLIRIGYKED